MCSNWDMMRSISVTEFLGVCNVINNVHEECTNSSLKLYFQCHISSIIILGEISSRPQNYAEKVMTMLVTN